MMNKIKSSNMRVLFLFILVCFQPLHSCMAVTQFPSDSSACKKEYDSLIRAFLYTDVDIPPEFENGEQGLLKYFANNIVIPDSDEFLGRVYLTFVVDTTGSVIGVRVRNKRIEDWSRTEKLIVEAAERMPKWKAGKCNNIVVPVKVNLPIVF